MLPSLQITIIVACILLLVYVVYLIRHNRLQLKYSLLWLAMVVILLFASLFPAPLFGLAELLGFTNTSNFVFVAGFVFVLAIALALTSIVSKQAISIKDLTQRIAILENELKKADR